MADILHQLEHYMRDTLGIMIAVSASDEKRLPLFLRELYRIYNAEIHGERFVLVLDEDGFDVSPSIVLKHLKQIEHVVKLETIYVRSTVSSYIRKKLIQHKVSFVVPNSQLFIPSLGMLLRERIRTTVKPLLTFCPAAQVLSLYMILKGGAEQTTPMQMARKFGYSAMTMTRAFNELAQAGIGEQMTQGRERILSIHLNRKELWQTVLPYLRTPVKRRVFVHTNSQTHEFQYSGQSALAEYTEVAHPSIPVHACSIAFWNRSEVKEKCIILPFPDPDFIELELWSYSPNLLTESRAVDGLSLYLSMRENQDERVQVALDTILRELL